MYKVLNSFMIYIESDLYLVPVITLLASHNGYFQDEVSLNIINHLKLLLIDICECTLLR